nr:hypothetical protein [uncultured Tyzzerella sp.]
MNYSFKLAHKTITIKAYTLVDIEYKNIGTTTVTTLNEDLSIYKEFTEILESNNNNIK